MGVEYHPCIPELHRHIYVIYLSILGASLQTGGDEKRAAASGDRATLREKEIGIGTGSQVPRRLMLQLVVRAD